MGDAPYIIVKKARPGGGQFKRSIRIARVWKHKQTGNYVEVRNVQNVVPDNYLRIVFFDPEIGRELSMPLKARENPFQPPNRSTPLMEQGFEDAYEVAPDQRSTRV
jgi:hypothetical protein